MTIILKPLDGDSNGDDGGGGEDDGGDVDLVGPPVENNHCLQRWPQFSKPLDQLLSLEYAIVKAHIFKGSPPLAAADEDDGATIMVVMLMTMMIMAKLLILMDCIAVRGNYK